jgi:hypothetical protein
VVPAADLRTVLEALKLKDAECKAWRAYCGGVTHLPYKPVHTARAAVDAFEARK